MSTAADLDDFFKKRDKKKKTKTTKYSKIDNAELASHLDAVSSNLILNDDEQQQVAQFDTDYVPTTSAINNNQHQQIAPVVTLVNSKDDSLTSNINSINIKSNNNDDGDDEWRQFESDENKNYSGLKINFLRTNESDEENETEVNNEVEKKSNCPWLAKDSTKPAENNNYDDDEDDSNNKENEETNNKHNQPQQQQVAEPIKQSTGAYIPLHLRNKQQQPQPAAPSAPAPSSTNSSGSYVPPHLRNSNNSSSAPSSGMSSKDVFHATGSSRRGNKNQPNINDEGEFPSLFDVKTPTINDSNQKTTTTTNDSNFEQPKRSSKVDTHSNVSNKIDIENKFNALSHE